MITTDYKTDYAIVTIVAEKLDGTIAQDLKSEFIKVSARNVNNVIVNLFNNKYCDSSGLSALLVGNRLCKNAGGKFFITALQENVARLIQISQLDTVLFITSTVEEAEAKI
ncbi:MAG: STAS domain-containing protein [Bacteroidia bacterium]|nr:STAS domain-containing protein [Bacteroidia bacterium]